MGTRTGTPTYNEWAVIREITVTGFAADADWQATQNAILPDGAGAPTRAFQVPNLPGRPATGFAVQVVAVDAGGAPVVPAAGTITFDVVEVTRYSGDYDDRAPHISDVEDSATPGSPLALTVPFNFISRVFTLNTGGAQRQFALRVSAMTAPAGAVTVRLLIAPQGGS